MKNLITICVILVGLPCWAIPHFINYQGYLSNLDAINLDTTVTVSFTIYDSPTEGEMQWTETHTAVTVENGVFNCLLGGISPITDVFSADTWLGITVGNNSEMSPRQSIASVAHAYRVGTVDGASGGIINGDVTILGKGTIGSDNLNTGLGAFVAGIGDTASGDYSTVSGGNENVAGSEYATVGGGVGCNAIGSKTTVSGGAGNSASGAAATIGGGTGNEALAEYATVTGGFAGYASGDFSTVCGGHHNTATAAHAAAVGGRNNFATGEYSFIAGGLNNEVTGSYTFACGQGIDMVGSNSFIFSDGSYTGESGGGGDNRFIVIASGGSVVYSNSAITAGVRLNAGANSWSTVSDSTKKRNISLSDTKSVLDRVVALPIKDWEYKSETGGTKHIGPMAQDFWNAFHLGTDSLGIETIDADGVMMSAIQELAKQIQELQSANTTLRAQVQSMLADEKQANIKLE